MESLYRKYRPLTFESVVGQQHIVSTLEHAVSEGRLSHAYLFCGPRGTGKTTMARILAKALLCERAEAARAEGASGCMPDGSCPECEAIAEGSHPDVYELDAASRTGVDSVREEIISSVNFAPVRGAYKVYIIDEVHMLTTAAFNALLKTLEEPPSHVVFVLCTTDPQKIPETILSRCQRFDFHRISNEDIVGRLRYICDQEGFDADDEALEIVARHARGGMRDALSTLEQLSVFGDGAVHAADARALLGEVSSTVLAEFARAIAARDVVALFGMIRTQVDEGNDLLEFTRDLVAHVRDVYTARMAGARPELFDGTPEEVAALVEEAGAFEGPERLARVLTVLDDAAIEMRGASDARLVLEIACTRLARPESDLTLEALAERIDRIEAQLAAGVPSGPVGAAGMAALTGTPARPSGRASVPAPAASRAAQAPAASPSPSVAPSSAEDLPWDAPAARAGAPAAPSAAPTGEAPQAASSRPAHPVVPREAGRGEGRSASSGHGAPAPDARPAASTPAETAPASAPQPAAPASAGERPKDASTAAAAPRARASQAKAPEGRTAPHGDGSAPAATGSRASAPSAAEVAAAAAPATPAVSDAGELQRKWAEVVKRVTAAQASRGALLQSSRAVSDDGSRLVVAFPKGSNFAIKMLGRADSHNLILPIVCAVFGSRAVDYVMDGAPTPPPAPAPVPGDAGKGPDRAPAREADPSAAQQPSRARAAADAPGAAAESGASHRRSAAAGPSPDAAAASPAAAAAGVAQAGEGPEAPSARPVVPGQPPVDQVSGPTVVPEPDIEADRRAWEDEQVPYDDATITAYEDEEVPPFDVPDMPAVPAPAAPAPSATASPTGPAGGTRAVASGSAGPAGGSRAAASGSAGPAHPATSAAPAPASGLPWASPTNPAVVPRNPSASDGSSTAGEAPFDAAASTAIPQTEEEAKELLTNVFGNVVFKEVETPDELK